MNQSLKWVHYEFNPIFRTHKTRKHHNIEIILSCVVQSIERITRVEAKSVIITVKPQIRAVISFYKALTKLSILTRHFLIECARNEETKREKKQISWSKLSE